jgi:fluoride exporter
MIEIICFIGIGGFFGAISRYWVSQQLGKLNVKLPIATFVVNIVGSFLLGFIIGSHLSERITVLFGTGFMGAFTTFSTFKLDIIKLLDKKEQKVAILYIVMTYIVGICSAWIGLLIGNYFT